MVSKASDDLPEPDSPVITTSASRGMATVMSLRLCSRAPETTSASDRAMTTSVWRRTDVRPLVRLFEWDLHGVLTARRISLPHGPGKDALMKRRRRALALCLMVFGTVAGPAGAQPCDVAPGARCGTVDAP